MTVVKFPAMKAGREYVIVHLGESTHQRLAIGAVAAFANGVIWFRDHAGREYELTDEQARAIEKAFGRARWAAKDRKEYLSGFTTLRIQRDPSGDVTAFYRGATFGMRQSKLRSGWHSCSICHQKPEVLPCVMWVGVPKDWHSMTVCMGCINRLASTPTEIRDVSIRGPEQTAEGEVKP